MDTQLCEYTKIIQVCASGRWNRSVNYISVKVWKDSSEGLSTAAQSKMEAIVYIKKNKLSIAFVIL